MCFELDEMELLYLRFLVSSDIASLHRRINKYLRYDNGDFDGVFQKKIALAQSELYSMEKILEKLNNGVAKIEYLEE